MDEQFEHSVDYELLGRYFTGECSLEEAERAENWIAASEENRGAYEALRSIWEAASEPDEQVDVNKAWTAVADRLPQEQAAPVGQKWRSFAWIRVAAVILVAVGLGIFAVRYLSDPAQAEMLAVVATDSVKTVTLPDGSVVTLNAGATLNYPAHFAEARRELTLEGEAFFEVERDPQRPFVIHAGEADVRVLGTSFNVWSGLDSVGVVVATGKVELSAPQKAPGKAVVLEPGEQGNFASRKKEIRKTSNPDLNYLYWKDRKLMFRESPLEEVAAELKETFGADIRLGNDQISNCPLTTTFDDLPIESILNIIAETFNLEVTQDANTYTLQGEGC